MSPRPRHLRHPSSGNTRGPRKIHGPNQPGDRDAAIRLLTAWSDKGEFPDRLWEEPEDAAPLVREIVWGCIRHLYRLNAWIKQMSRNEPHDRLRPALWVGLYQVLELDGIKPHAAVHETVEAAKRLGLPRPMVGYLNAVLRRAAKEREELKNWMDARPLHIRTSHPLVLLDRWSQTYGHKTASSICFWDNHRARTLVRRTQRAGDSALPAGLEPHPAHPDWFVLKRGKRPETLPGFAEGFWYVQDPSTRIAPALLQVRPGEAVLDACAAPGGKTALLAEALEGQGRLVAMDRSAPRLQRLRENFARLQLPAEVVEGDVNAAPIEWHEAFDAILLDVPCSNTGVLQRRPDARWRFDETHLKELTALQASILDAAAPCLRPGGRLVYSTCSIEPEEGPEQVRSWLATHPGWTLEQEQLLLPGEEDCDGAYAARLRRT